jgi:hypothetical protein
MDWLFNWKNHFNSFAFGNWLISSANGCLFCFLNSPPQPSPRGRELEVGKLFFGLVNFKISPPQPFPRGWELEVDGLFFRLLLD